MLLVVRTIIWSSNFFLLRGYLDMCNLLDGLVAFGGGGWGCKLLFSHGPKIVNTPTRSLALSGSRKHATNTRKVQRQGCQHFGRRPGLAARVVGRPRGPRSKWPGLQGDEIDLKFCQRCCQCGSRC